MLNLFIVHDDPMEMRDPADRWISVYWADNPRSAEVMAGHDYPEPLDDFMPAGYFVAVPVSEQLQATLTHLAPATNGREYRPTVLAKLFPKRSAVTLPIVTDQTNAMLMA